MSQLSASATTATEISYKVVAEHNDVSTNVPVMSKHWTCGVFNRNTGVTSYPFGKKENGINRCNLESALKYTAKEGEEVFFQTGMQIQNGVFLNRFFYGITEEDFGKSMNSKTLIKKKFVPSKNAEFLEVNFTKISGKATHELKINSDKNSIASYEIPGTDQTINIAEKVFKEKPANHLQLA